MADLAINIIAVDAATDIINKVGQAFQAVGQAISDFVSDAAAAELQQAKLVALLNSTGGAAGMTQEAVNALAMQFRDLAGGSDEAIVAIETIGLRSGAIAAE